MAYNHLQGAFLYSRTTYFPAVQDVPLNKKKRPGHKD